jgi:A/G-specific adenine glycosylase
MTSAHVDNAQAVAPALILWHRQHGRHDLPWQQQLTPYRVWVSEVMLQQTQVQTVIPYFQRFIERFPEVRALATASSDEVLHLWSGLGYYSRARNLQRAAQIIAADFGGQLPAELDALCSLPGIGRSTAAAILALTTGARHAILDGNVKRVLSRYFAIDGSPSSAEVQQNLWLLAEHCTPANQVAVYTQAIMDLGATLCTRSKPRCEQCPLQSGCIAFATGRQAALPAKRVRAKRSQREVVMLVARQRDGSVLLRRRPVSGVWGGLWCLPEFTDEAAARIFGAHQLRQASVAEHAADTVHHAFTHFDLAITPLHARCDGPAGVMDASDTLWYNSAAPARIGLPAPIQQILEELPT